MFKEKMYEVYFNAIILLQHQKSILNSDAAMPLVEWKDVITQSATDSILSQFIHLKYKFKLIPFIFIRTVVWSYDSATNFRSSTNLSANNVWFIKIRTTHNLSLWLYEYFWIILLYGHLVYFIIKVLAWEICNMKWGFAKKVIIKSQRQFMYG